MSPHQIQVLHLPMTTLTRKVVGQAKTQWGKVALVGKNLAMTTTMTAAVTVIGGAGEMAMVRRGGGGRVQMRMRRCPKINQKTAGRVMGKGWHHSSR